MLMLTGPQRRLILTALGRLRADADGDPHLDGCGVDRVAAAVIGSDLAGGWGIYKAAMARLVPVSADDKLRHAKRLAATAFGLGESPEQVRVWLSSLGMPDEIAAEAAGTTTNGEVHV